MKYPVPPASLMRLSTAYADAEMFVRRGAESLTKVLAAFDSVGRPVQANDRVLEWGCGCGRMARHALERGIDICGVDISEAAIEWCRGNLDPARFSICSFMPPTNFPDHQFDFIYAGSVITHISLLGQLKWMQEISRILKPGGHVLLTFHGVFYFHKNFLLPNLVFGALNNTLFYEAGDVEGSNEYGTIETVEALETIFFPFERKLHIQAHGILGAQDTAVFKKQDDRIEIVPRDLANRVAVTLQSRGPVSPACIVRVADTDSSAQVPGGIAGQYFVVHFNLPSQLGTSPVEITSKGGNFNVVDSVFYREKTA